MDGITTVHGLPYWIQKTQLLPFWRSGKFDYEWETTSEFGKRFLETVKNFMKQEMHYGRTG